MDFLEYSTMISLFFVAMLFIIILYRYQNHKTIIPTNWPVIGMIPALLLNYHRIHDYATEVLMHSGGTYMWKGPWFSKMNMLVTTDPLNIHHILSKNFINYPKGDKFLKIFDILGDGILSSNGKTWEISRKVTMSVLNHSRFQSLLETTIWNKVENELLPFLESFYTRDEQIDLQDVFLRFNFDTLCKLLFDEDLKSLSLDFRYAPCLKALTDADEATWLRHLTPPCLWRLQQLLRVGKEIKLSNAWKTLDQFLYNFLDQKINEYNNKSNEYQEEKFTFFTTLMAEFKVHSGTYSNPTKFFRDTLLSLMTAGKSTTSSAQSWFFYLLARNPIVEDKILKEIITHLNVKAGERWHVKELDKMVYLHGALCETLRLFPSVPFNHKSPSQPDILPSGHQVDQNTTIILSYYHMGRMKSIWGEDWMEFKPERWISDSGGIKREPSYKFATFNAGPRTCVGKNISLSSLKIVSTMIIYNYHIELVDDRLVLPANTIPLQMKHGLNVKLTQRNHLD